MANVVIDTTIWKMHNKREIAVSQMGERHIREVVVQLRLAMDKLRRVEAILWSVVRETRDPTALLSAKELATQFAAESSILCNEGRLWLAAFSGELKRRGLIP